MTGRPVGVGTNGLQGQDMTELLEKAIERVRALPPETQDDFARVLMSLADDDEPELIMLTPEERTAIVRSKAAAARGEFATDEEVQAVWAKHGS